jgi:acyl carrier protein
MESKSKEVERVRRVLAEALQLGARAERLTEDSRLLGGIPEFNSTAIVIVLMSIEKEYDIRIENDELSPEVFSTVGTLARFLERKNESRG